jgi:sporulation protein YlmC with PRC-barrel domain
MLILSNAIINKAVLSLRTNGPIATTTAAIINPNNLKVEGLYCQDRSSKSRLVLLFQDVRNVVGQGIVVNDHEVLSSPDILVRLQPVIKLNFALVGKAVITADKTKVGKVRDFAIEAETFYIQKLYVNQSIIKNLNAGQLSIDRSQIIEVTDKEVIIQELVDPSKVTATATAASGLST